MHFAAGAAVLLAGPARCSSGCEGSRPRRSGKKLRSSLGSGAEAPAGAGQRPPGVQRAAPFGVGKTSHKKPQSAAFSLSSNGGNKP